VKIQVTFADKEKNDGRLISACSLSVMKDLNNGGALSRLWEAGAA